MQLAPFFKGDAAQDRHTLRHKQAESAIVSRATSQTILTTNSLGARVLAVQQFYT